MKNKQLFLVLSAVVVIAVIVFAIGLLKPNLSGLFAGGQDVSSKVEKLYELVNPGVDVSTVKVDEVSGMYKVLLKAVDASGTATYREVYVTKDGELMTESMVIVAQSTDVLTRTNKFVDCLESKGVKIFGVANHTGTLLQFNVLGGNYATKLYGSCDGQFTQQCIDAGITEVPTTIYEGKGYAGAQSIEFFQKLTGCAL
ncbi:MAG: hypothetical protein HYW24_01235 [Candidatus Aenigmarchaeota archaeon]|nr:hypothetical protein [Candidatus Aenigmarchaeota archaeon]